MEGVTCLATRLWFSQTSQPDFAMTPFLRVTRDYPWKRVPSTYAAEIFDLKGSTNYFLIPQIMGTDPCDLERIATPLLNSVNFVDVNCGCPSPKVVGSHAGSGLLEKSEIFYNFLSGLQKYLGSQRFSVKMRTGFLSDEEFPTLLNIASHTKLAQLTLHARTRKDRYTGQARWSLIDRAARECPFPVVGSGDIVDANSFKACLAQAPEVDKVIIGRGALRNPWIFDELRTKEPVTLTPRTLILALATFVLLQDLLAREPLKLISLIREGDFYSSCGNNEGLWERLYTKVSFACYGKVLSPAHLEVDRVSFARLKMIWNSLRSSLGGTFMNPSLLRVSYFSEFEKGLMHLCEQEEQKLTLKYYPQYDWIYSGAKNNGLEGNK